MSQISVKAVTTLNPNHKMSLYENRTATGVSAQVDTHKGNPFHMTLILFSGTPSGTKHIRCVRPKQIPFHYLFSFSAAISRGYMIGFKVWDLSPAERPILA